MLATKWAISLLVLFLVWGNVKANEKLDSLHTALEAKQGPVDRAGTMLQIANYYYTAKDYKDSSVYYCYEGLHELENQPNKKMKGDIEYRLMGCFYRQGKQDSALFHARLAYEFAVDSTDLCRRGGNLGLFLGNKGFLVEAIGKLTEALELGRILGDKGNMKTILLNLGGFYNQCKLPRKAISTFDELVSLAQEDGGLYFICSGLGGIANSMYSLGKLDSSILYYKESVLADTTPRHDYSGDAINNIGINYQSKGEQDSADYYYRKAFEIRRKRGGMNNNFVSSVGIMGLVMNREKKPDSALYFCEWAEKLALESGSMSALRTACRCFEAYHRTMGHHEQTLFFVDSLRSIEQAFEADGLDTKIIEQALKSEYGVRSRMDSLENARAMALSQAEIRQTENENRILMLSVFGAAVIVLILALAWHNNRKKRRLIEAQRADLQTANAQKDVLMMEIHHRVKNNLQLVSSLLNLQSKRVQDPKTLAVLNDGQSRVKSMALIHQTLYSQADFSKIELQDYIQKLIRELLFISGFTQRVQRDVETNGIQLDIDTAIPIGLILNELITNSIKYAFAEVENPGMSIQIHELEAGLFQLDYRDNGPGMDELIEFKKRKTLGFRLVQQLSRQLFGVARQLAAETGIHFLIKFKDEDGRKEHE